jgi:hemin uptake protein HemP
MTVPDTLAARAGLPSDDVEPFEHPVVTAAPARQARVRSITSEQLFAAFPEVQIVHGDTVYRLRRTSLGKLILTK